jgi:hypothetical protein
MSRRMIVEGENLMSRARMLAMAAVVVLAMVVPAATAHAAQPQVTMKAKITSFAAVNGHLVARGVMTGTLRNGSAVTRDTAPVRFRVAQRQAGRRCDVLTLNLQQLFLELLGARVETSAINLELYARRGAILGNLFCALSRAKVVLPRVAAAMNRKLDGRPLPVMAAQSDVHAADHQGSCQVLKLILGPLHLDLLGLNIDLYGKDKQSPVIVTISGLPGHGLLGDLLCALAGGGNINSIASLQGLLRTLGVNVSDVDLQALLTNLGITDLSNGLSVVDLQRILQALGLGTATASRAGG